MATKPVPSAAEIAEKKKRGWKAVEPTGPVREFGAPSESSASDTVETASAKVDAVLPDTRDLLRKYLGDAAADAADSSPADTVPPDVELVDLKSGDLQRTVGVNRKSQKIEWSQG